MSVDCWPKYDSNNKLLPVDPSCYPGSPACTSSGRSSNYRTPLLPSVCQKGSNTPSPNLPSSFNLFYIIPIILCGLSIIILIIFFIYSGFSGKKNDSTNNNGEFSTDNPMSKGGYFYFD
jgi:hypothetical protein